MNILITGGAGFIGSHLVDKFISRKYNVIAIDNLLTGTKKNLDPFLKNENFTFLNLDVKIEDRRFINKL